MAALEVERFLEAEGEVEEEQPAAANGTADAAKAATPELVLA
jgi:hypothetical protein